MDVLFKIKKVNITDESELGYFVKATAGDKKVNKNFNVYVLPSKLCSFLFAFSTCNLCTVKDYKKIA